MQPLAASEQVAPRPPLASRYAGLTAAELPNEKDLATESLLTRSGLSRVVERLERKGLVTRTRATEDGRGPYAELTAAGADRFAAASDHHIAFVRSEFLSRFTRDELRTLGALLRRANDPTPKGHPAQP